VKQCHDDLTSHTAHRCTRASSHTRRGRSRAQHVRDREADIERAKKWRLVHLRTPKARAAKPSPHLGCVFVQRRRKRRMAKPEGPSRRTHFWWRLIKHANSSPLRLAIGCFQGNQYVTLSSSVLFRTIALQQTVLPPSRALILCAIARKSLIITDFLKTGSRNMAETCAINFLTLVFYSTSIVIGGLRRLLLPVLM